MVWNNAPIMGILIIFVSTCIISSRIHLTSADTFLDLRISNFKAGTDGARFTLIVSNGFKMSLAMRYRKVEY